MFFLLITDNVMKRWGHGSFANQCIQIQSNVVKMFVEFEIKLQLLYIVWLLVLSLQHLEF